MSKNNNLQIGLQPYGLENAAKYAEKELKNLGTKPTKSNSKNASKNAIARPRKMIGFTDLSAFDETNTSIYSKKKYEEICKESECTPKTNENSKKARVGPNEPMHFSDTNPYHPNNVYIYMEDQLLKVNSSKTTQEKETYDKRKNNKYEELKALCLTQNTEHADRKAKFEEDQQKKANAKSGKTRVVNALNLNSEKNDENDLIMKYLINPINLPVKKQYKINCNLITDVIKQNIAYFIENIFNYNVQVREGWFQLIYLFKNIDYKNKRIGFNYKSLTEFFYKQHLLIENNRNDIINIVDDKINEKLKTYNKIRNKIENASTTKKTALSKLSNAAKLVNKSINKAYNFIIITNEQKKYFKALEDNLDDEATGKVVLKKIIKEISNLETAYPNYYKSAKMSYMSLILQNKLQNKLQGKEDITFEDCFLTSEDVNSYLENMPKLPDLKDFPTDEDYIENYEKPNENKIFKYYQELRKIEYKINIKDKYLDPKKVEKEQNEINEQVLTKILAKMQKGRRIYNHYVNQINTFSLTKQKITKELKIIDIIPKKTEEECLELNINSFNSILMLLYTYFILTTGSNKFSYIFSYLKNSGYYDTYYSENARSVIDVNKNIEDTLKNNVYDQSFYRCIFNEVPSGISDFFDPLDYVIKCDKK